MDKPLAKPLTMPTMHLKSSAIDVAVLILTAPLLLVSGWTPRPLSLVALALLAVPFIVRRTRTGRFSRPAALNLPIAILACVFLPAAMVFSPAPWTISWPRVAGLAWSLALYFAVLNVPPPRARRLGRMSTRLGGPTWAFLALGAGIALAGLLTMRSVNKLFFLPQTGWLATRLGWEQGLPTNEVAGVLTLFVPFTVALAAGALWTRRQRLLLALTPLAMLLLATLVLTQSRTGLMASLTGTVLALVLGARPTWKRLAAGLLVAVLLLTAVAVSPLRDWFIFAGANSWQSVVGPRLGIWNQALDGIRDHPIWGMGLGTFGLLARLVYPLAPLAETMPIEDAHNLYLQTALDFGVVGGLLLVALMGLAASAALSLTRLRPRRSLSRLWAAGLVGSLAAHALYSLTDAVALGTLGGLALWFVFGLVMGGTSARTERAVDPYQRWAPLAVTLAGLALLVVLAFAAWPVNRAGQMAGATLLNPAGDPEDVARAVGPLAAARCRAGWYEGLLYQAAGDAQRRAAVWTDLLACAQDYTGYMAVLAPRDVALARQAIAVQPDNPAAYFWLATIAAPAAPGEAIDLYRQGLALAPRDARRWLDLARLLEGNDAGDEALDAYLQACIHGDPGANACAYAATIVADRGDLVTALRYYRLSNWSEARARAEELERQLSAGE